MFSENIKINRWKEHLDLIIIQKDKHLGCIFYAFLWRRSEKMHRKFLIYTTSLVSIISKIVFVWWPYDNYLIRQNNIWKNEFGSRVALWFLLGGALSLSLSGMPRGAETRSFFRIFQRNLIYKQRKIISPLEGVEIGHHYGVSKLANSLGYLCYSQTSSNIGTSAMFYIPHFEVVFSQRVGVTSARLDTCTVFTTRWRQQNWY